MNDLEYVTKDLASGKLQAHQIEKNLEKWMNKLINHLLAQSMNGHAIVEFTRQLLDAVKEHNLSRAMSQHCVTWMTAILRDLSGASNPTAHLSVIALVLSYHPGPCKPIKRRDWLNLLKLASSEHEAVRNQVATILACASRKEKTATLFGELLITLANLSSALIGAETVPESRSIAEVNDSFLVLATSMDGLARVRFISRFLTSHLAFHGGLNFPLDVFICVWRRSALMSGAFEALSSLLLGLIRQRHAPLLPLSKTISAHLIELTNHRNEHVRAIARQVAIEWFTIDRCNGIVTHHLFGAFVQREIKQLEQRNAEQIGRMGLVGSLIGAFGPFLPEMAMVEATSATLRMLADLISQFNPSLKAALIDLAGSLVHCQHHMAPMALCQMHVLIAALFNSRHMDSANRRACRQLLDSIERLQRPYNTPTLIHQREMIQRENPTLPQVVQIRPEEIPMKEKNVEKDVEERVMKRVNEKIESILGRLEQKQPVHAENTEIDESTEQSTNEEKMSDQETEEMETRETESEAESDEENEEVVLPAKRVRLDENPKAEFKDDPEKNEEALENIMALFEG